MKKYICEAIGTMVLVLFGTGAACFGNLSGAGPILTPFAFGLAIVAMAYVIGEVSGCHVNPAVSLAMYLDKRINEKDLLFYIIAQLVGAFVGSVLLFVFITQAEMMSQYLSQAGSASSQSLVGTLLGVNGFGEASTVQLNMVGAIVVELILTFVFVLTVLGVSANKKMVAVSGVVIGLTLAFVHILGIPLTGTSVNPARSFGPALMTLIASGDATALSQLWVFIIAPLVGGALAAGFWRTINKKRRS